MGRQMSGGCCGGGGWSEGAQSWAPGDLGLRYEWEVTFPDSTTERYPTDTQAYAAVARTGGGVRRVEKVA